MRMKLMAHSAFVELLALKGWSNRRLAEVVGCAPGTIDNLVSGRTQSVNGVRTARRICQALGVPFDVFFVPVASSNTSRLVDFDSKERDPRKCQHPPEADS